MAERGTFRLGGQRGATDEKFGLGAPSMTLLKRSRATSGIGEKFTANPVVNTQDCGSSPQGRRHQAMCDRVAQFDATQQPAVARVIIVSEVRLYREGLESCLLPHQRIDVIGLAHCLDAALVLISQACPDVVLIDMGTHNGPAISRAITTASPLMKIVGLAMDDFECDVREWAVAGITAYVSRDGSVNDLVATIHDALEGELHCSPRVAALLLQHLVNFSRQNVERRSSGVLTCRELEIVGLIDDALSNKEIARRLQISVSTVKNHVHNILEKSQARRRAEASAQFRTVLDIARGHLRKLNRVRP
jgi:two-component system, NarL family, nitrate/nitrite response regulator NarL